MDRVYSVLKEWEFKGEMTIDMARVIDENIDQLMKEKLGQIEKLIEEDKPDFAFVAMLRLTSFINAGAAKLPSIIRKLEKWIKKLKSVANFLAKKLGANGFSISAGLPAGVSVGLSFPIS
jgi:hypothetical protein